MATPVDSEPIQLFVTGGTFDKEYNELTGELFFQKTHIADMLRLGRCRLAVTVETLMMIDSLEMTDAGRQSILERCEASPAKRIVITHGTDSMEQTAAVLGRGIAGKTIVLTGAMVPYQFGSLRRDVQSRDGDWVRSGIAAGGICGDERPLLPLAFGAEKSGIGDFRAGGRELRNEPSLCHLRSWSKTILPGKSSTLPTASIQS